MHFYGAYIDELAFCAVLKQSGHKVSRAIFLKGSCTFYFAGILPFKRAVHLVISLTLDLIRSLFNPPVWLLTTLSGFFVQHSLRRQKTKTENFLLMPAFCVSIFRFLNKSQDNIKCRQETAQCYLNFPPSKQWYKR